MNRVIIPVGSTGYAAKKIYDEIKADISNYPYLMDYIDQLGIETNTNELVSIIIKIVDSVGD